MSNKQKYHDLCKMETSISIFSQGWWLDAVCGKENWNVVLIEKGGQIVASFPYYLKRKYGFQMIQMPMLTQTMGPWIRYPVGQKYAKKLAYEKDIFSELIALLPDFNSFLQNFHYSITNWLPFYWHGFVQTTRYTYVLNNLTDVNNIYDSFRENIRREIRKAEKFVEVYISEDIELFYQINKMTFERQNKAIPYSLEFLKQLDMVLAANKCRKIFLAKDEQERIHAAVYIIWDTHSAYYLMGGGHPELRHSGAHSLLIWKAIQHSATVTKKFDFEGSMIEPVERFFRGFGAVQTPYSTIRRECRKMRLYRHLREFAKAIIRG